MSPKKKEPASSSSTNLTDSQKSSNKNKNSSNNNSNKSSGAKDEGKYFELEGAKQGEVVVRFPPEASGYLHIGHAKAALLNAHYQKAYQGKLIFRFDDTNPEKEKESFEKIIEGDVELLEIVPDMRSYTSDYFQLMQDEAEKMIKSGKAYVDDTEPEQMKAEREQRVESANRSNSVEKNLEMWREMVKGSTKGQKYCLRAKIDMSSDNGALRDPTIYRCKPQAHPRTGDKFKAYPTYDFACPIVDSLEGVTHALRTSEYMDRDAQYYWFCDALEIRKPRIAAYSRLNLMNTVLSKRKLTFFVEQGVVEGWDDPRMPTVRGILRRGLTVEGLKQFIASQGSSKAVVVMDWDKIWAFNRKVIDPIAPRYSGVEANDAVTVEILEPVTGSISVALHPKHPEMGQREVPVCDQLLIDQTDAQALERGQYATFISWGNLTIKNVKKQGEKVTEVIAGLSLDVKDFKKTYKLTWLAKGATIPALFIYYDHIIRKPVLGKDDDFKQYMNTDSKMVVPGFVDAALASLKRSQVIQLQRKGFFICDEPYDESTVDFTGKPKPICLISVPDGSTDLNIFPVVVQEWKKKNVFVETKEATSKSSSTSMADLDGKIRAQGDAVRKIKSDKSASKEAVKAEVDKLLALKADFKKQFNQDWTPDFKVPTTTSATAPAGGDSGSSAAEFDGKIRAQGEQVRKLKSEKASKEAIKAEVDKLLALKADFKKQFNLDWTPDYKPTSGSTPATSGGDDGELDGKIRAQGDLVRKLKSEKASKEAVKAEVDKLLALKADFKKQFNKDWTPDYKPTSGSSAAPASGGAGADLDGKIRAQGDLVRKLKSEKADKKAVDEQVALLLKLKGQFKEATGSEWKPDATASKGKENKKPEAAKKQPEKQKPKQEPKKALEAKEGSGPKKQTRLGMETKKADNYSEWYTEVITKAEMIEYYDVSGCYILRPWSYAIWEAIQRHFDARIKSLGVQNCYFPMFISRGALETEKTHIADFAPEVAWVTKSGQSDMAEPIAIRPTSETVMYPSYAKWVQSHRDLPIRLNQWCNVVRWEFKQPTPFLRTREFLWQEGHSAFATEKEALEEVFQILDFYAEVYEELLAIPVIKGRKSEKEKFAGGQMTTTCEAYVHVNGRGIQGATSHFLGQNFSKMFELVFEDPDLPGQKRYAYQNSWGLSTRSIGAVIMIHGDDKGLVLPPRVALLQVVIVPCGITASTTAEERKKLIDACQSLADGLKGEGVRVKLDDADHHSPGWKFNHWELKGVPIRIELGPKDLAKGEFVAVRRDISTKQSYPLASAPADMKQLLETIHGSMFANASKLLKDHLEVTDSWEVLLERLDRKFIIMAPFCGEPECEEQIKKDSAREDAADAAGGPLMGAKSLCIPNDQPRPLKEGAKCVHPSCSRKAQFYTLFGRSY